MSKEISISIDMLPLSVNEYLKPSYANKGGKIIPYMRESATSKNFKSKFRDVLKAKIKEFDWDIEDTKDGHWYLDCEFVQTRTNQDSNNFFKILLDSMTGLLIDDDKNILVRVNRISYDSKNPHMELRLHKVSYIGVFDNLEEIDKLKTEYCSTCSKNKRCALIKKGIDGYESAPFYKDGEEVVCDSYKKRV